MFEVGDMVRARKGCENDFRGGEGTVTRIDGGDIVIRVTKASKHYSVGSETISADWSSDIEIIKGEGEQVARRTFRLKKNLPDYKKGLIVQEACDNGDQEYNSINHDQFVAQDDHEEYFDDNSTSFSRKTVEESPSWFEEVFNPGDTWFTKAELDAFKKFVAKNKKRNK